MQPKTGFSLCCLWYWRNQLIIWAHQLSGGQRQRVAIARAIVNKPSVILADEPTGALDTETTKQIMELFKGLNQSGMTIIIVTHDAAVAEYCSAKITILDGKIVE